VRLLDTVPTSASLNNLLEVKNMTEKENTPTNTRLFPAANWPHPWPPLGGLRHLIFHAKSNGFDRVIKRVGRRVLIDEAEFFRWVEENNSKKGGSNER
jgi:hypothetical protein